jgi:GLPGLI family protein
MNTPSHLRGLVAGLLLWPLAATAQPTGPGTPATALRAIYRLDYRLDSAVATPKRVLMILRINKGTSCFEGRPKQVFDSVYVSLQGRPEMEQLKKALDASGQSGKNEFRYSVFKEPAKNLVAYHDIIGTQDYQYQEPAPLFQWQLTAARQTIAGYECQQAFTAFGGRMWEAWFTRAVPVSDGPYKFYGLPGLMLKVRDTHDNYVFELIGLGPDVLPIDISAGSGAMMAASPAAPIIKKSKFKKAKYNDELTFLDQMASHGNQIPESLRASHFARLKRHNNPLELK